MHTQALVSEPDSAGERHQLADRVRALIDTGRRADAGARDALLLDMARWQARNVRPYRRLLAARAVDPVTARRAADLPAIPTDVFRYTRVAAHAADEDVRLFQTSGTTSGARGEVHLRDLSLYDRSARAAATVALFPDRPAGMRLISLVPTETEAPHSSLAHMVARFMDWFGTDDSLYVWRDGAIDDALLAGSLDEAEREDIAVCLLGTSFAFVFAAEAHGDRRWRLPAGSRIMQTGGFKGRTREIAPDEMRRDLSARHGIDEDFIIAEYGMSELSSQLYESTLADRLAGRPVGPRRLLAPPWLRVTLVDPQDLLLVEGDSPGLIRIEDPANLDTAWAIQTSDLGRRVEDGIVLIGRAADAVPRGCSLAVEEALAPASAGEV